MAVEKPPLQPFNCQLEQLAKQLFGIALQFAVSFPLFSVCQPAFYVTVAIARIAHSKCQSLWPGFPRQKT